MSDRGDSYDTTSNNLKPLINPDDEVSEISKSIRRSFQRTDRKSKSLLKSKLVKCETNVFKHAYGNEGDSSDSDSSDDDDYKQKVLNATPNTRRILRSQHSMSKAGKIGPLSTFFTLLKGFVATSVLFLPKGWRNGGWLFSTCALLASCILTIITSLKLIEIRRRHKLSFSQIGYKAYGTPGKIAVDLFLALTQTMFVCAYIPFIVNSVNDILEVFDVDPINKWILGGGCFLIFIPLVYVRKIEKFAFFHIFADIAIMIGVLTISIYAGLELKENGNTFSEQTEPINTKTFMSFIGLASYTFEGIGIIIPIMETTSRPDLYPYILSTVIFSLTLFFIFFGNFCYFIYGYDRLDEDPMITSLLPNDDVPIIIVKIIWIINLICTYPLVLHPANMVIESYIFRGWRKSPTRRWSKNATRTVLVIFTIALSLYLMDTLDKLESINGAFACIPLAFLLPCMFHYKLVAETPMQKFIDLTIAVGAIALQIVCTIVTFIFWNE